MTSPALILILLLVAAMSVMPLIASPVTVGADGSAARRLAEARTVAEAMVAQQRALIAYAMTPPTPANGTYAVNTLPVPAPWKFPSAGLSFTSVLGPAGGHLVAVTYYTGSRYRPGDIATALIEAYGYAQDAGWTGPAGSPQPTVLVSPQYSAATAAQAVPLPTSFGIPTGVPALADIVQ